MKNFAMLFLLFYLGGCTTTCKRADHFVKNYHNELSGLLELIKKESPDLELIKESSLTLMDLSEPIYVHYVKKSPDCRDFLKGILDKREQMLLIDLEAIERDFHEGEALPPAPDHCFHAKELVVHPATVYLLAKLEFKEEVRADMLAELVELGVHLDEFMQDRKEQH